jgi:syntaxin 7
VQTKLSKEFTTAVAAFQRVQRLSAEKQRSHVETQKRRVEELADDERWVRDCYGGRAGLTD